MKKVIFFVLLIFSFISCQKNKKSNDENWIILNDKNKLPTEITDFFVTYEGESLQIANPNENFNITDVVKYPNAPFRQLRLMENKNDLWRLVYLQGGIGESHQYYEFSIKGDSITNIKKGYSFENIETNDSLEYYIKIGKVHLDNIKVTYKH